MQSRVDAWWRPCAGSITAFGYLVWGSSGQQVAEVVEDAAGPAEDVLAALDQRDRLLDGQAGRGGSQPVGDQAGDGARRLGVVDRPAEPGPDRDRQLLVGDPLLGDEPLA